MKFTTTAIAACLMAAPFAMAQTGTGTMPPGHPAMPANHPTLASSHDAATIRQVQQELTKAGYDAGPADGHMGPKTRAALADYQRSKGISGHGLDNATLSALGVSATAGSSPGSSRAPGEGALGSSPNQQPAGGAAVQRADRSTSAAKPPAGGTSKGTSAAPGEGTLGSSPAANAPASRTPAETSRGTAAPNPQTPGGPAGGSK